MQEHDAEPVRGLPGRLPAGEEILWQGAPDWRRLARDAFKTRWIAAYFGGLLGWAAIEGNWSGAAMTAVVGALGLGGLHLLAWLAARSTVYTLTNRRIVLRFGIALNKCINLPLAAISSAGLKRNADGTGDIPLTLSQAHRLGYAQFWPHARPWKLARPEPMLRSLPDAAAIAERLSRALLAVHPEGQAAAPAGAVIPGEQGRLVTA